MWAGGKTKMIKHYLPHMPSEVKSYCEPFFGGGAMFIHVMTKYNPNRAVINDINQDIMRIYRAIKTDYKNFITFVDALESKYLPLSKPDRKKMYYETRYMHAWHYGHWCNTQEAATLYFLLKTGFNGVYQLNHNTNGRYGTPAGLLNQKDKVYDRNVLQWWNNVLQQTEICSRDWKDVVDMEDDTFYFCDPPYRQSFANYGHSFTDDMCKELIQFCDSKSNVMLCNRDDDEWFADQHHTMNTTNFDANYTVGRKGKKEAKEILLWKTA